MEQKTCKNCNITKNASEFYKTSLAKGYCKVCHNQKSTEHKIARKVMFCALLGSKCSICGYMRCVRALEFHHVNPKAKEFNISKNMNNNVIVLEIDKCILVCSNSHREIHSGLIPQSIIDEIYKNIDKQRIYNSLCKNEKVEHKCRICGIDRVSSNNRMCNKCKGIKSRRVKSRPPMDELREMISATSYVKVAEKYGVTDNTIRKWLK